MCRGTEMMGDYHRTIGLCAETCESVHVQSDSLWGEMCQAFKAYERKGTSKLGHLSVYCCSNAFQRMQVFLSGIAVSICSQTRTLVFMGAVQLPVEDHKV